MVSDRAFIFHIYIPWENPSLVPKSGSWSNIKVPVFWEKNGHCRGINISQTKLVFMYLLNHLPNSLVFSSTGRRPASLCHGPLSVVRPSVRALTFSLNIFFAETTYQILMKFHRNVPTMVLFRIS